MDQQSNIELDRADEDILTDTVSDEALEAASGAKRGADTHMGLSSINCC